MPHTDDRLRAKAIEAWLRDARPAPTCLDARGHWLRFLAQRQVSSTPTAPTTRLYGFRRRCVSR